MFNNGQKRLEYKTKLHEEKTQKTNTVSEKQNEIILKYFEGFEWKHYKNTICFK